MNVVVTGSSGRIGSSLVRCFERDGYAVTSVDRPGRGATRVVAAAPPGSLVVHCAGNPNEQAPWSELHTDNVLLAAEVLDAAVGAQAAAIVLLSSEWVVMDPSLPYARSKIAVEALAQAYAGQSSTRVLVDRVGSFDGRDRPEAGDRFAAMHVSPEAFYRRITARIDEALR